jgi:hypothetical protein
MSDKVAFFLLAILIVGLLLLGVIFITRKGPRPIDVEKYRSRWLAVEQQVKKDEETSYTVALLNADKLLDQALLDRGYKGKSTADRMKAANFKWSNANSVWTAHKTRNKVAHEQDFHLTYDDTRRALVAFRQALKDLGAL